MNPDSIHRDDEPTDPFLQHEALDRCHVLLSMLEDHLAQHPFVVARDEIHQAVRAASESLARAYQLIGAAD